MVLLGSRHSGSTQRIREFLSRNGQPFTYQDVETDPQRAGAARSIPHRGRRRPGDRVPGRPRPQEPVDRDAVVGARPERRPRSAEVREVVIVGARAGGAGRRGLRRVRGAGRAGAREHGARRAGGHQLAHRELPRASPPGSPGRRWPDARSRRPRSSAPRWPSAARSSGSTATAGRTGCICPTAGGADARHRHRHRREVPEARAAVAARASRGPASTTAPPTSRASSAGRGDRRRGRGQLRRPGGGVPRRRSPRACTCWCAGPGWPRACRAI